MSSLIIFRRSLTATGFIKSPLFVLALLLSVLISVPASADSSGHQKFGDFTVHYSVFASSFLTPEVARVYGITRAANRALVNVSVTRNEGGKTSLGLPADVEGTATNLIQQQRELEFRTISEGEASYYLADLRHTNEEVMNFVVTLKPAGAANPLTLRFTSTLHTDNP